MLEHQIDPFQWFQCTNEYRRWIVLCFTDDIQHPVHAIGEVNVGQSRPAIHHSIARGAADMRVASQIGFANVSFSFDDETTETLAIPAPHQATT